MFGPCYFSSAFRATFLFTLLFSHICMLFTMRETKLCYGSYMWDYLISLSNAYLGLFMLRSPNLKNLKMHVPQLLLSHIGYGYSLKHGQMI